MPLHDCYKRLRKEEDLYLVWPYQNEALSDIWGAVEELSRFAEGTDENPLENTLGIIAKRFANIMEEIDERIWATKSAPRSKACRRPAR